MSWTYNCSYCGESEEVDEATQTQVAEKHKRCMDRYEAEVHTLAYRIVGLLADARTNEIRSRALDRVRRLLELP